MPNHVSFSDVFQSEKSAKREATPLSSTRCQAGAKVCPEPVPEVVDLTRTLQDLVLELRKAGPRYRYRGGPGVLCSADSGVGAARREQGISLGPGADPIGPQEREDLDDKIKQVRVHTPILGRKSPLS